MDKPVKYLTKKGEIRYRINYSYKNSYGVTKRSSKGGFLTSKEAKAFARAQEDSLESNVIRQDYKMSVQKLFEIWLETVRQHVKETTFDFYKHMTKHFKYLYEMKIADITPQLLENYYYKLMEGNSEKQAISASTIKHANTVIKIALEFAVKNDLLGRNVAKRVKLPNKKAYEYHWYNMEQIAKLMKIIKGTYVEWPVKLACCLGLRRGEVCALQWKDIDFDSRICYVYKNIVCISGRLVQSTPKTKYGFRKVPVSEILLKELIAYKHEQRIMLSMKGMFQTENTYICLNPRLEPANPDTITRVFRSFLETKGAKYGLPVIRFHDLRHSFASNMIYECGVPTELVSKILGHSTSAFTVDTYGHASDNVQINAIDKFDDRLRDLK